MIVILFVILLHNQYYVNLRGEAGLPHAFLRNLVYLRNGFAQVCFVAELERFDLMKSWQYGKKKTGYNFGECHD